MVFFIIFNKAEHCDFGEKDNPEVPRVKFLCLFVWGVLLSFLSA